MLCPFFQYEKVSKLTADAKFGKCPCTMTLVVFIRPVQRK